jgi:DNA-binding MarR family transcriptional regulator
MSDDNNMTLKTRKLSPVSMPTESSPSWTFLTRHAQALLCIADDPSVRLRDIGLRLGITERAAHRIVGELVADGYITRERRGRRNHYTIRAQLPLPDAVARDQKVGDLLVILTDRRWSSPG